MKLCPFCAEEIQDAAIRCKHCRSDLAPVEPAEEWVGPVRPRSRTSRGRQLLAGVVAVLALALVMSVLARPVSRQLRAVSLATACEPTSWSEWHDAFRNQCVPPSYVCEHLTSRTLLRDPDAVQSFGRIGSRVPELVSRMRQAYGCSPEPGPAVHPEPGPFAPPAFPPSQDEPRDI